MIPNNMIWADDNPEMALTKPVRVGNSLTVGGQDVILMTGPCSVESYDQTRTVA